MTEERWLEMDLYWFQGGSLDHKVDELFTRLTPLWGDDPQTRKGLAICVGWLFDMVLYWNGQPDDVIACCQEPTYQPWTYRQLKTLIDKLKDGAHRKGIQNFNVALILMGIETQSFPESACEGWSGRTEQVKEKAKYDIVGRWFPAHREVYDSRFDIFYFGAPVHVPCDEAIFEGQPDTFGEYFAVKLSSVCDYTGFDAVVLRDTVLCRAYIRGCSKGRYMQPEDRQSWNDAIVTTLSKIKQLSPSLVLIGYSSGTSSVEEWRSHGFDLEQVAASGCLDLWITQTWASAWGDYWPAHSMGFTFQLMNALVHQAMLVNTPCKHLFLIEMFDAWEPWDSIHQYPSKVQWEIWAYSHATVLLPDDKVSRSSGCYISWMNRRSELLPAETVSLVSDALLQVSSDLEHDPRPGGPCVVYPRTSFESSLERPLLYSRGEEVDDWTAMLVKYALPVLSITRSEWLENISADGYLYPLASNLSEGVVAKLLEEIRQNKPVLLMGCAEEVDDQLRDKLDLAIDKCATTSQLAVPAVVESSIAKQIGTYGLVLNQRYRSLGDSASLEPLIEAIGGPVFALLIGKTCWIWETPEWGTPFELHMTTKSIQSPQTYALIAMELSRSGWGVSGLSWHNEDWTKPVCFLFWRYSDGTFNALLANLETGVTGNSQFCVGGKLSSAVRAVKSGLGQPGKLHVLEDGSSIRLYAHRGCLVEGRESPRSTKPEGRGKVLVNRQ